jgi:hypothetical protein
VVVLRVKPEETLREGGFRISASDAVVLLLAGAAVASLWRVPTNPGIHVLAVVGHFFLFCNVIRLRRAYELVWAVAYVVATALAIAVGLVDGWIPLAGVTPLTALLVGLELRSPRYHGVAWRRINPGWQRS